VEITIQCQGVLFDLDGTLVDSTAVVERVWSKWAAQHNLNLASILAVSHGRRTEETIRLVAPHLPDAPGEAAALETIEQADLAGVRAIAGAQDLIATLPRERWGIVTSCPRELAVSRLEAAGLPVPRVLVTADNVTNGKPHPEPYLLGAAALGVDASECLVFEDAPAGIDSALAAGMQVAALTTTHAAALLAGKWCLPDLASVRLLRQDGPVIHLRFML
jgi:mannitol-1-/sugar-/sorbitol-6-phosphatase